MVTSTEELTNAEARPIQRDATHRGNQTVGSCAYNEQRSDSIEKSQLTCVVHLEPPEDGPVNDSDPPHRDARLLINVVRAIPDARQREVRPAGEVAQARVGRDQVRVVVNGHGGTGQRFADASGVVDGCQVSTGVVCEI